MTSNYTHSRYFASLGALFGASAIIMGALGSHYFALGESHKSYQTAVYYQLLHAILLLSIAALPRSLSLRQSWWISLSLVIGILLFSGSLYLLTVAKFNFLGFLTPIGGLLLISAWFSLAICIFIKK